MTTALTVNEQTSATYEARQALKAARATFRAALEGGRRTQEAVAAYQAVRFARALRSIARDWYADEREDFENSPAMVALRAKERRDGIAAARAMGARRKARAAENRRAKEMGCCPRCVNGYIPNMPIDGGICYRCNGTGRA